MGDQSRKKTSSDLKFNERCPPDREINILLMGQTGTGKTTFINSLANYFIHDTLDEAIKDEIKIIIPTSFYFHDEETFEAKLINIGDITDDEGVNERGQSCTQQCRSFIFPFGSRNLRLIDTPGMGDTRGSQQDNENLFEILTYISHYEHLNAICIFLKPNEERLTIVFRLFIKQILHYLGPTAADNIVFIFTSARTTHFAPGNSKKLLQTLLKEYSDRYQQEIPFAKANTFLVDNEAFRYLALHKKGIQTNDEQVQAYRQSWDYTIKESERFIEYVSHLPLQAIASTLSLNEAEQLIKKLSRPIAETIRLIQYNIQLATQHNENPNKNKKKDANKIPQMVGDIALIKSPKLICFSNRCLQKRKLNDNGQITDIQECENGSYLDGVVQEVVKDPKIQRSKVFNKETNKCGICDCSYKHHMNITYEYKTRQKYRDVTEKLNGNNDNSSISTAIQEYINELKEEQKTIDNLYMPLSKFLHVHAIHPCSDDIIDYLQLFIREEKIKGELGIENKDVINNLTAIFEAYQADIGTFQSTSTEKHAEKAAEILKPDEVFLQVGLLSRLQISGRRIRDQVDLLKHLEDEGVKQREQRIRIPRKAAESRIMRLSDNDGSPISTEL
ncbi:unnamed protein product [Rotaria socialis]|uniref:G domain-containing protein n=2 Tax=Rotaria socialis TaxID=392032 RepID=A0A818BCK8_9BILA|nr:unnamed protein product [Rotaria socialis]CAF3442808.1 unnamed protein product [Rotaria socialis]CAF3611927.1 unnamed protein product [Rotaria socialis]CAF4224939.1 unnamed protein product [Rotaria socialis]CAF4298450.1 unnamed protein product [Rotaria socialis]